MTIPSVALPAVVYAEDDENDAFLIRHCWKRAAIRHPLEVVADGQHAIDYLTRLTAEPHAPPLPALLLLDLNMPRKSGLEVLAWVRGQPQFTALPVAVLSSSNQKLDTDRARVLGATDYFVKPSNVAQLHELVLNIRDRWLEP